MAHQPGAHHGSVGVDDPAAGGPNVAVAGVGVGELLARIEDRRAAGDGRHVYVSNRVANTNSRIDYQALAVGPSFPAPAGPDCMDVSADGTLIMVASRWAGKLSLIDVNQRKVVHQVKVGKSPHGVWTLDHAPRQ